jgi:HAD superfamily hydrolase (TIGR01509 family)
MQAGAPSAPQALIFDLDGLLIDTEEACFLTAQAVLERHGTPGRSLSREGYARFVGRPIRESYATLRAEYDLAAAVEQLVEQRNDHILEWYRAPVLLPGAEELVRAAHATGLPVAIASAAPGVLVDTAVAALPMGGLFSAAVSADHPSVAAPKPAPDVYLTACELLGVRPGEAVAIEDSPAGATAALAAGLTTYVVPNAWTRGGDFPDGVHVGESLADLAGELLSPRSRSA